MDFDMIRTMPQTLGMSRSGEGASQTEWMILGVVIAGTIMIMCVQASWVLYGDENRSGCLGWTVPLTGVAVSGVAIGAGLATGPIGLAIATIALLLKFQG